MTDEGAAMSALREAAIDAYRVMDAASRWAAGEAANLQTIKAADRHMAGFDALLAGQVRLGQALGILTRNPGAPSAASSPAAPGPPAIAATTAASGRAEPHRPRARRPRGPAPVTNRGRRLDPDSRQLASEEAFCWWVEIVVRGRLYRPLVVAQDADGALEIALTVVADLTDLGTFFEKVRPDVVGAPEQLHPVAIHHPGGASFGARQRAARRAAGVPA